MAVVSINTNISSQQTQRRLAQTTNVLRQSFERLSSGLRINRAADDAAGLAIAQSLAVDSRVYTQGIRNLNDAVSLVNIADGATGELSNVLIRLKELAQQSANGTLSLTQRRALDQEAFSLSSEFNRIVQTTFFNGRMVIDGTLNDLRIQSGYGESGALALSIGEELARSVGDGTFTAATDIVVPIGYATEGIGDFNGDGVVDRAATSNGSSVINIFLSDGNGGYTAGVTFGSASAVTTGDFDNDGKVDIIYTQSAGAGTHFVRGNGDGTFAAPVLQAGLFQGTDIDAVDLNNDGKLDLVGVASGTANTRIFIGNGNGTFQSAQAYGLTYNADSGADAIRLGDFNGDGAVDIVARDANDSYNLIRNNGDGTFSTPVLFGGGGGNARAFATGDINHDGYDDLLANRGSIVSVYLGQSDGSLLEQASLAINMAVDEMEIGDIDGDGVLDVVANLTGASTFRVLLGNDDGTFDSIDTGGAAGAVHGLADMNRDGVVDIINVSSSGGRILNLLGDGTDVTTIQRINLLSQADSRSSLDIIEQALVRLGAERGAIGSALSRVETAISNLQQLNENYQAAASGIMDADVAMESATLLRSQILQQAGSAILGQANQLPALALRLLTS